MWWCEKLSGWHHLLGHGTTATTIIHPQAEYPCHLSGDEVRGHVKRKKEGRTGSHQNWTNVAHVETVGHLDMLRWPRIKGHDWVERLLKCKPQSSFIGARSSKSHRVSNVLCAGEMMMMPQQTRKCCTRGNLWPLYLVLIHSLSHPKVTKRTTTRRCPWRVSRVRTMKRSSS